jgi:hypothetical protein
MLENDLTRLTLLHERFSSNFTEVALTRGGEILFHSGR